MEGKIHCFLNVVIENISNIRYILLPRSLSKITSTKGVINEQIPGKAKDKI